MNQPASASQPLFLDELAQLLYERIQLGKNQPPVLYEHKQYWDELLKGYLDNDWLKSEESATRTDSGAYYMLAHQLIQIWKQIDVPEEGMERLYALDAFFDFMEKQLRYAEKRSASKRVMVTTQWGTLMLGGRPLLADMPDDDERAPLDADRLYRRVCLLNGLSIDEQRELIDGSQYKDVIYKLNRAAPTIGLAALSGKARTHFKATGQLKYIGNAPEIGFESEEVRPAETYTEELRACIDWAVANEVQLLCLPELSVCPNGRQLLKDCLAEQGGAGRLNRLAVVIAGSYHVDQYNETPVWLVGGDGNLTEFFYRKHEAYGTRLPSQAPAPYGLEAVQAYAQTNELLNGDYYHIRENIISNEDALLLRLPVGLVGVLICKDFLSSRYYNKKYDALEPDYLFIVSMNSKADEFMTVWQREAKRHALSAGFYVNATQVVEQTDSRTEVVFWGLPFDPGMNGTGQQIPSKQVFYRNVVSPTQQIQPLPTNGLVRVKLPASRLNYDTSSYNLV